MQELTKKKVTFLKYKICIVFLLYILICIYTQYYIYIYIYKISYICVYVCYFFFYINTIQFQPYNLIQIIRLCILQIWDIKAFYEIFLICAEDVKKKQQIKEAKLQVCNYYFIVIILCCARFSTTGQKNSELPL